MHRLVIRALLDVAAMRCDDDAERLLPGVFGHLEEPGAVAGRRRVDDLGLDHSVDLGCAAESLAAGEAGADDVRAAGIVEVRRRVRLRDGVQREVSGTVGPHDSNLLADGASDRPQQRGVRRAPFRVVLERLLRGQVELEDLCLIFGRHGGLVLCLSS